jgi:hypothetical protein
MDKFPIYKMIIDDNSDTGLNAVALVDQPAIERMWMKFNAEIFIEPQAGETQSEFLSRCIPAMIDEGKEQDQAIAMCISMYENKGMSEEFQDSYDDYPKQASENAKIALRWAEENGWGDCGTSVGKARANQLAKGEPISRDTIARMAAFERHRQNSQKELGDGCGRLMWLAWGGDAGIEWAQRKLEQIDREQKLKFAVQNEERRIVTGPLMIANLPIYRKGADGFEFYVVFDAATIEQLVMKYHKDGFQHSVNLMHNGQQVEGVYMFESFIIDSQRGITAPTGFDNIPDGSWFGSYKIENDEVWNLIKAGTFKGFSVEGFFLKKLITATDEQVINKLKEVLS